MNVMRSAVETSMHSSRGLTTMVTTGLAAGTTAFKAFNKVSMGEVGVRHKRDGTHHTRGRKEGQPYGIKGPGIYPVIPFLHSYKTIHVRDRTNGLPEIQFNCEDRQLKLDASVVWHVRDDDDNPWRALYRAENLEELTQNVTGICVNGLRLVASSMSRKELQDHRAMYEGVEETCRDDLLYYGSALKRVNISAMTETVGEMIRQSGQPTASLLGAVAVSPEVHQEFIPRQGEGPSLHAVT